jgi:hypothetical protein
MSVTPASRITDSTAGWLDVGDVAGSVRQVFAASFARLAREPAPGVDRQACESGAKRGIAHQRAQFLVCAVVHAEAIAVRSRTRSAFTSSMAGSSRRIAPDSAQNRSPSMKSRLPRIT